MLYLIGLGLGGPEDVTIRGLKMIQMSKRVFLESYTSLMPGFSVHDLKEAFSIDEIIEADREMVEERADTILDEAKDENVSFLVVGDPLAATTHCDLLLRAKEKGISFEIIHNASIVNAIACTGLELYRFGEIASIPLWTETWKPDSFMKRINENRLRNLHTLCLLDIKINEPDWSLISKSGLSTVRAKRMTRFMTYREASKQIAECVDSCGDWVCVAALRIGCTGKEKIIVGKLDEFAGGLDETDPGEGGPLHSLVVTAPTLHFVEKEMLKLFASK